MFNDISLFEKDPYVIREDIFSPTPKKYYSFRLNGELSQISNLSREEGGIFYKSTKLSNDSPISLYIPGDVEFKGQVKDLIFYHPNPLILEKGTKVSRNRNSLIASISNFQLTEEFSWNVRKEFNLTTGKLEALSIKEFDQELTSVSIEKLKNTTFIDSRFKVSNKDIEKLFNYYKKRI